MTRISDTARQREVFRYYQPLEASLPVATGQATTIHGSNDLALTAFAQVGALRLNAQRGVISLIGRDSEYIIAEAGKTLSLQSDYRFAEGDGLWNGVGPLPAGVGLGLVVMNILTDKSDRPPRNVVVGDLTKDERFSHLATVIGSPFARFLASWPLRTPAGYPIGLYSIIDDQPRSSLSHIEMDFLQDMAKTIMGHLESGRIRQKHHRAERMVKALGLFLEGNGSLRDWWINQGEQGQHIQQDDIDGNSRRGISVPEQADMEFGVQEALADNGSRRVRGLNEHNLKHQQSKVMSASLSGRGDGRPSVPTNRTLSSVNSTTLSTDLQSTSTDDGVYIEGQESAFTQGTTQSSSKPQLVMKVSDESHDLSATGKFLQEVLPSVGLKEMFGRASNLMREATDVNGVAFFDASISFSIARSEHTSINDEAPGAYTNVASIANITSSTSEEEKKTTTESDDSGNQKRNPSASYIPVLGFSTRTQSSFKGHDPSDAQRSFSEQLLRQLTKRYPHGKIFNFDENESVSTDSEPRSSEDQQCATKSKIGSDKNQARYKQTKRMSREQEAAQVLSVVPGARSVAWFPLWDHSSERWYAGILLWSTSNTRIFSPEEEIVYMASFANSIMAEVARLSALAGSQLKMDFVSSISHELRSPLHGILANVEFLEEDHNLTSGQADKVNTINNCGRTLLQTIDHVLDFANITQKQQEKTPKRLRKKNKHQRNEGPSNLQISDIRGLAEEVIDAVYAGRRSWKSEMPLQNENSETDGVFSTPIVILDIMWHEHWHFGIDGGAWRRILMNLFSNAMKYTDRGFVQIIIHIDNDWLFGEKKRRPRVCLEVKDSGRGISKGFLKSHIYTAFKQEDSFSAGTGLGLNIVRQIVFDLGGTIDIKSEVGEGTQAHVSVPLTVVKSSILRAKPDIVAEFREKAKGLKACLINAGFDILPALSDAPSGTLSPEAEALILLKASLRSMLVDWFGIEVVTSPELDFTQASIHLMFASTTMEECIRAAAAKLDGQGPTPIVIIICNVPRAVDYVADQRVHIFYLQQPVSPRSLAAVLSRWHSSQEITSSRSSSNTQTNRQLSLAHVNSPQMDHGTSIPRKDESASSNTALGSLQDLGGIGSRGNRDTSTSIGLTTISHRAQDRLRILLVEDNNINLNLLILCMTRAAQPFVAATNGAEAVAAYKAAAASDESRFTTIFMDIQMPIQDGLSATREIRRFEQERGLPRSIIFALTASVSASVRRDAVASGMDKFLTKPVPMKELKKIVNDLWKEKGEEKYGSPSPSLLYSQQLPG